MHLLIVHSSVGAYKNRIDTCHLKRVALNDNRVTRPIDRSHETRNQTQ